MVSQLHQVALVTLIITSSLHVAADEPTPTKLARGLKLLGDSAREYIRQRQCFSCHHQALPAMTLALAESKGLVIDADSLKLQAEHTHTHYAARIDDLVRGKGVPGGPYTAGYALATFAATNHGRDEVTDALVDYLMITQQADGHWRVDSKRPPLEESAVMGTAMSIRGLRDLAAGFRSGEVIDRVDRAAKWLAKVEPKSTEDHVFLLFGRKWADASVDQVSSAAKSLAALQREDGGWSQLPSMESDAYATGSALVALHQAGGMPASDPAWQRGVTFLRQSQRDDGSWLVESRSKPFQKYFESGFPHGKSQFISIAASSWSLQALILAGDP